MRKIFARLIIIFIFLATVLFIGSAGAQAVQWPLRISAVGKYLEDQNGVPFPIIGDAVWYPIEMLSQSDMIKYLDQRQALGFTTVEVSLTDNYFPSNHPNDLAGNPPFTNGINDWSVFGSLYWTNSADYFITQARNRGMLVIAFPAYTGILPSGSDWANQMKAQTESAMTTYGQAIGNRYKNLNVIYIHGGDLGYGNDAPELARVADIAAGIQTTDTLALQTVHWSRELSASDSSFAGNSWLNLNSSYTSCSTIAGRVQTDYQRSGALPFFLLEGVYEYETAPNGDVGTTACIQHQALVTFLGGGLIGHVYGNGNIWHLVAGTWDGSTGIGSPGSYSIGYIGKLIRSRAWNRLIPDYDNVVVTSSKGTGLNYHSTAREGNGETIMVWCPDTNEVTVDMAKISGSQAKAWWWNPDDNSSSLIGTYSTTGTGKFTPSTARKVLVLDDGSKNLAAPGTTVYSTDKIPPSPPTNLRIISP